MNGDLFAALWLVVAVVLIAIMLNASTLGLVP